MNCHDCGIKIKVKDKDILNGKYLDYGDVKIFKCNKCFSKNAALKNYQRCEVYSRVVGFLRPVQEWNKGKQQEYKDRKTYGRNK
jgi:anaerobic ribonucleoside-triphosphate reductase